MACRYCAAYIKRALEEVDGFEEACRSLRLDPAERADWEAIVKGMAAIGQFGTSRLAQSYPFLTDEEQFRRTADVGLHFYWMLLDFWEEERSREAAERHKAAGKN